MRYNILIFFISFIICDNINSQQTTTRNNALGLNYRLQDFVSNVEQFGTKRTKYIGSYFLFDDWKSNCKIQISKKIYTLNNVNFNIRNNQFIYKIGKDSIFTVSPEHIDFINVNDKKFKYHLYNDEIKFFEVLFESKKKLSILMGYHIRIVPKSDIGMLNRPFDEIIREKKYYILNGSELLAFKLKKKDILKFINKDIQHVMIKYIEEKNLSYKKEKDVIEIFKNYDTH